VNCLQKSEIVYGSLSEPLVAEAESRAVYKTVQSTEPVLP